MHPAVNGETRPIDKYKRMRSYLQSANKTQPRAELVFLFLKRHNIVKLTETEEIVKV